MDYEQGTISRIRMNTNRNGNAMLETHNMGDQTGLHVRDKMNS